MFLNYSIKNMHVMIFIDKMRFEIHCVLNNSSLTQLAYPSLLFIILSETWLEQIISSLKAGLKL